MPPGRLGGQTSAFPADFPSRSRQQPPEDVTTLSPERTSHLREIFIMGSIYFTYGLGSGLFGPLYPREAVKGGLDSRYYGAVMATRYLSCLLTYPIACRMATSVSSRLCISVSIFTIGSCQILFGTVALMGEHIAFVCISFAVQIVEGIGMSMLLVATILVSCSGSQKLMRKMSLSIQIPLTFGLATSPVIGKMLNNVIGFDKTFYSVGCLIVLVFLFTAVFLPEPENQVKYADMPVVVWMKNKRMMFYFLLLTGTFIYVGFITVCLDHILWKFHLNSLEIGLVFAILPLACGITLPGWTLLIKRGFNSVMKIFIGSVIVLSSLLVLGPIPFVALEASLKNVCIAMVLAGLGIACKCACLIDSIEIDLRLSKLTVMQQQLVLPTIFSFGAFFGQSVGALVSGFSDFLISYKKTTLIMFGLEVLIAVSAVVFAFNRNYRSATYRETSGERQQILRT